MKTEDIIKFCNEQYDGIICEDCERECNHLCSGCLQTVHHGSNREYDCKKITCYYVNKFIYKYSSEIQYLLERYKKLFGALPEFRVLSIGCGPCTELFGINDFLSNHDDINQNIKYLGVDINPIWQYIHDHIYKLQEEIRFLYRKIEKEELIEFSPNILVLQYVISHIYKQCHTVKATIREMESLMEIVDIMESNSYIILNDINNYSKAPYFFNIFNNFVQNKYPKSKMEQFYFVDNIKEYYSPGSTQEYGTLYGENGIKYNMDSAFQKKYDAYYSCSSAQMLIQVIK